MKNGINKLLYERRKELHYSRREASIKIDCSRIELYLIEHGYIHVREKYKENFIYKYKLAENFFDDDYRYPLVLDERKKKTSEPSAFSKFISKLFNSKKFRITSIVLTVGFTAMLISGCCMTNNTLTNTRSFYSEEVLAIRDDTVCEKYKGPVLPSMNDTYYSHSNILVKEAGPLVSINFFGLEENLAHAFFTGSFSTKLLETEADVSYSSRVMGDNLRTKIDFKVDNETIAHVTADVNFDQSYSIVTLKGLNADGDYVELKEGTTTYTAIKEVFDLLIKGFDTAFTNFFANDDYLKTVCTFNEFISSYLVSCGSLVGYKVAAICLVLFGAVFALLFLALAVVAIFGKTKVYDKVQIETEEVHYEELPTIIETKQKPIKKNWKLFPCFAETFIRSCAILLLFAASIVLYFVFKDILSLQVGSAVADTVLAIVLSNFTIIGTMIIFFLKLDIYQDKKTMFLINYAEFFLGLGYYLLLVILKNILLASETSFAAIGVKLLAYIPGNILWGCLTFNLLIMFLFFRPKNIMDDPKKVKHYRLMALLPLSYLIASCVLSIGKENFSWDIPFEVYNLFFSKSAITVIFAVLFVFGAYFYKERVYKKYGKTNAELYIRGNKYYFTKNLIASVIILGIGIFEVLFKILAPNNPYGIGSNSFVLLAIPFILLYHPHHDKRNGAFDTTMCILYYVASYIGIALIALACIQFLVTI